MNQDCRLPNTEKDSLVTCEHIEVLPELIELSFLFSTVLPAYDKFRQLC